MAYTISDNIRRRIAEEKTVPKTVEDRVVEHARVKNAPKAKPTAIKTQSGSDGYKLSNNLVNRIRAEGALNNGGEQLDMSSYKTYIQPPSKSEKGGGVQMTKAYSEKRMQDTANNLWLEYGDKSYSEIMAAVSANDTEDPFMKQYENEVLNYIGSEKRTRADIENEIAQTEKEIEIAQAEWDEIANTYVTTEGEGYTKYQDAAKRVDDLTWKKKNLEGELWMWDQGEIYGAIPGYSDYEKNSGVTGKFKNDSKYNFINDTYGAQSNYVNGGSGSLAPYEYMTEEQKGIYNYLYNVSGKKAANEYLDYISYDLNRQRQADVYANAQRFAVGETLEDGSTTGGSPVAASVASVGSNLISGIGYVDVLGQEFVKRVTHSKAPIDYNRGAQSAYNYTQGIRQGVTNSIDSNIGKKAYNLGMSLVDSATLYLITAGVGAGLPTETIEKIGKAGTMLLGGSGATSMMHDVVANGGNDGQALALGFVAGAAEYAMENLSLESLFKIGNVKTGRQFVYSLLKQSGVEATEEALTTLANTAADIIVMGDKNELQRMYNEYVLQGYSHEEAERLAKETWLKGLLEDTAGGFISGLTFGLGGAAASTVAGAVQFRNSNAADIYGDAIPDIIKESKEAGVGSGYIDRIQGKLDNGKTVKVKEVNRLINKTNKAFTSSDIAKIQEASEARLKELGETGDTSLIASALAKQVAGKRLTSAEREARDNSKYAQRVVNELSVDNILSDEYSTEWSESIGTKRVNAFAYNLRVDNRSDIEKASDKYGVQAEAMVSTYNAERKDQDVDKYDKAYQVAFNVGKENGNLDALKKTDAVKELTEWQIERAYEAGQAAAKTVELSNVDRIESIKGGKMTIRLSNGNVIDSSDAIYASSGIAGIYSTVGNLGVTAPMANNIIGTLTEDTNAAVFAKGVAEAFKYGKTGMSMTDLMNNSENAKKLTDKQRNTAYNAGKKVAGEAVARAQAKAEAKKGTRIGKVHYDGNVDELQGVRRAGYQAAEMAAKMLGTDIYFFESYAKNGGHYYIDANGNEVKAPNGWYDPRDKSIHLDINAGNSGEGIVLFTLAHELTHFIKDGSPRHFKILANTLFNHLGETESVEAMIAKKMEEQNLSHDKAYEEVVADAMETVLNSGNVLNALADIKQQDASLWNKIKDFFKKFVKRLRNIVSAYSDARPDSIEGRLVADIEGLIAKLEPIFTEGLAAASENMGENMGDDMTNEEAFTDSSVAIMNQIRPPYTDKSKAFDAFADSLNPEAKKTFDLFYNFYQKSLVTNTLSVRGKVVKKVNISSPYMLAQEWNEMLEKAPKWAATARELAEFLPADVRKRMNMNEDGTLNPSPMEKEFRMPTSLAQRLVDALPYESIDAEYTLGDKTITLPEGKARQSVGGEAYRRAILAETRKLYSEGKLKQVSIGAMSKDKWGSMGFLAANGKTGASGDFTTVCPQMMFNRGCWYCYRRAAMESGVNNKLVAQNVWYTGEILRIKDSVIEDLNYYGGLRIQSFGDWMPHFSAMLADVLYDAELRGLQVKIITKEPSMINYIAALREQGIGKNLYFNLSVDYTIEKGPAKQATDGESLDTVNPERPYMRGEDRSFWWKRAMTVEEASKYRSKYSWVNTRIVAATLEEFIRGLKDPTVDVVTGYHGNIRQYDRIDSATGKRVVEVEALGDAGMPRFAYNPASDSWIVEYEGKTATHKKLAAAIMENNLQMAYYTKTCCITGRCATCNGKCGALSKDFNVKNATNRDAESVAYWQQHMQYAIEPEFGDMTTDDGVMYQARNSIDPNWQSYELEEEFLREVPYGDRHLFLRSLANQTSDIADGGNKRIVITGGSTLYFFNATGYMNGNLEGKMALTDNNQPVVRTVRKEYLNGIYTDTYTGTETSDQMAQSFEVQRGRSGWDYATYEHPRKKRRPDDVAVEESDDDTFGDYWEILGYSTYEEFVEAVKSGTMIMDENGDLITFDDGDGVSYQQRSTDGLSNRAILANALTAAAQNDAEQRRLKEYSKNIEQLNEQETKLALIEEEIREIYNTRGKRDMERLNLLRGERTATQNRIDVYDKKLLRLEATAPLQAVLERERKKAYDKARAKGKEALAAQRKKADEKLEATKKQYQESRKKNVEQRKTTAMRNKVKEVVAELNKYLLHGTKDKHIPIGLQKPVAEALDIINMDTVGAAERIAHYDELIAKFADDPKTVEELTATRERIRNADDKLSQKLSSLKSSYADIKNSDDPLVANAYDEVIASTIDYVVRTVGDTPLRDMTYAQLSDVYDMYKMILTKVRDANKAFATSKKIGITEMSEVVIGELKKFARESDKSTTLQEFFRTQDWNNLKPIYAFERMGSGMLTGLYEDLRMGEDTWIKDAEHAKKFFNDTALKYQYSTWDMDKRYEFTSRTGVKFSVSLQQILSLYAYSKREQADAHLERGGFVFDDSIEVKEKKHGIPVKYTVTTSKAHNLSREILGEILAVLTPDQRAFADEMQTYLSETMGEKGNEVTLQMYGVKLFKEKNYFPLKSAKQFMFEQNDVAGEVRVKNSGFTKEVTPHASNPIILSDFIDVWTKHVNDMAMYHSFVLPLEDFTRVFNFKTPASEDMQSESVKSTLENAFGTQATGYINQLLKDINGGIVTDSRENLAKKLTASFKKAAVFASLSVVVQQPSAIGRAFAEVDFKYFFGDKVDAKRHKRLWAELKQYAPVAAIKEMGYFDTNMGKSAAEFITSQQYIGFKEKAKAVFKDSTYRDELFSKLPALADELTWCAIWDAVKRETRANNPDMKVNSEEFLTLAGQRFTEVIEKTQVYDSVFARSANMRSKSALMGMATSFLAEPTTTINMVFDAVSKFARGDKKQLRKVAGAVMSSIILNSLLSSIIYAMRDDDEDETYAEKWFSSFVTELIDGINPLTYLPFVKDVWSILQGYDVERADMTLVSKLYDSMSKVMKVLGKDTDNMDEDELIEHHKNVVNAFLDLGDNLSSVFGIPVKNIRREFSAMVNVLKMTPIKDTTWNSLVDNVGESVKRSIPFVGLLPNKSKQDKLYEAITSGDEKYAKRLMGTYETESALNTAIRKALRNNDDRIKAAAEAKMSGNADEYLRIVNEIVAEGFFSQDNVVAAIKSEVNAMTEDKTSGASAAQALFSADDYFNAVVYGDAADAEVVKNELVEASVAKGNTRAQAESSVASGFVTNVKNAYEEGSLDKSSAIEYITKFGGKSRDEAETELKKVDFELEYGFPWSERDNAFRLGDITESELITAYMDIEGKDRSEAVEAVEKIKFSNEYGFAYEDRKEAYASGIITREELKEVLIVAGGKTEEEAEAQIRAYDWQNEGFDVSANSTQFFEDYDTRIAPAGIGKGIYYDAYKFYNAAGEEGVAYSKTTECMPYIDSLPLTAAQKTELARCWWSDRTINKYKLW